MDGQLIVVGLRDAAQVVTLRLMSRDHDAKQFGRAALGEGGGVFGELSERDSESSGDEDALEQGWQSKSFPKPGTPTRFDNDFFRYSTAQDLSSDVW